MPHLYLCKRQKVDERDYQFEKMINLKLTTALPISYRIKNDYIPGILDQGNLGSCTANAASNAVKCIIVKENRTVFQPSRLYIYWFTRYIEHTTSSDSGASLRDTMIAINKNGSCDEELWPYIISKYTIKPPTNAINNGIANKKNFVYMSVQQNLNSIKNAISQNFPIVIGIDVYSSFESEQVTKTGIVPMPNVNTEQLLGGHAIMMISYDDTKKVFGFMNSWGKSWGNHGFFTLPYGYVLSSQLAFDFWTIKLF